MRWLLAAIDQFPVMQAVNRSLILFLLDDRDAMLSGRAGISPYPKNAAPSPSSRGERPARVVSTRGNLSRPNARVFSRRQGHASISALSSGGGILLAIPSRFRAGRVS